MMGNYVLHLTLLAFLLASGQADEFNTNSCPDFWTKVGNNCYKVSPGSMSWPHARQYCIQQGGNLIEIRSQDKQDSLSGFLLNDARYWIGLTDVVNEGTFVWQSDFERATSTFSNWEPTNQPDNWNGNEDCVHLWGHHLMWNDLNCEATNTDLWAPGNLHALCETSMQ